MLGYRPGFEVVFDGWVTLGSALLASAGFVITSQILIGGFTLSRRILSACVATVVVSAMHYYGMSALKASALIEYDRTIIAASIILAGALFGVAYVFGISRDRPSRNMLGWVSALLAVAVLHFGGMIGMNVLPIRGFHEAGWAFSSGTVSYLVISGIVLILVTAMLAAGIDSALERILFRENRRRKLLADSASEAILVCSEEGSVVEANKAAEELFGCGREEIIGASLSSLTGADLQLAALASKTDSVVELEVRGAETELIPVELSVKTLDAESAAFTVVSLSDQRERLKHEAEIRVLAFTDHMTGIANRTAFQRHLQAHLDRRTIDPSHQVAVMLLDLDEFKEINDQFGHGAGDIILKNASEQISARFNAPAMTARLGGDEFAVVMCGSITQETLEEKARELISAFEEPVPFGDVGIRCGVSIGIAMASDDERTTGDLFRAADRALYAVKNSGRGRARVYDADLHEIHEMRRSIEAALARAIENEEFILHYQPKVCSRTRRLLGYEALIRWERPGVGMVMPGEFIEIAEQSMMIIEIGRQSIMAACLDAAEWDENLTVSVNLSGRQFADPKLYAIVRQALRESGLAPQRLELEITETSLIQNIQHATKLLAALKKLGVRIALDDFGTGYSSMRFVQQFPFDRIKIDKSFVSTMETDPKSFAIVDAILRLGRNLNIPVVAEGVETEAQAVALCAAQCEELQGYVISRPMSLPSRRKGGSGVLRRLKA
jgi:diguanylate cyclase (GGDEF)-like protein/PAS domain S-box-containing protein